VPTAPPTTAGQYDIASAFGTVAIEETRVNDKCD
jgi:hypothetical protein